MSKDFSHGLHNIFTIPDISGIGFQKAAILTGIGIDFYNHTIVNGNKVNLLSPFGRTTHFDASTLSATEEAVRT